MMLASSNYVQNCRYEWSYLSLVTVMCLDNVHWQIETRKMSISTWVLNTCRHVAAVDRQLYDREILAIHTYRERASERERERGEVRESTHVHPPIHTHTCSLVCRAPRSNWCSSWEAKPNACEIQSGSPFQWPWPWHAAYVSMTQEYTVLPLWSRAS